MWGLGAAWLVRTPALAKSHAHELILLFGAVNVDLLSCLMLAHIAGLPYSPLRKSLLPVALGVLFVGLRAVRRDILKRLEEGRPLRRKPERKVQTA